MTAIHVTTQAELDAALHNPKITYAEHEIIICNTDGEWITIGNDHGKDIRAWGSATVEAWGSATVRASDSATVRASGSATVRASDSATVRASGSATVRASDSATVRAWGSATVEAWGSATVRASDSATVRASGSATVEAWGSATVRASGSATVEASDSATVEASDSATVRASGSATVEASDSATVRASGLYVVTRRLSTSATVTGGTILDLTTLDLTRIDDWAAYHGAQTDDGMLTLYKAIPADGTTGKRYGHPVEWPTGGGIVECNDWVPEPYCGGGLHLSPTPWQARQYLDSEDQRGARFLECRVPAAEVIPLHGDKVKAPSVVVVREVDADGNPVAGGEAR
ncbi:DUF2807 domain-containing protein [Actinomyces procaprae]|uniref:DUF2807 domain-containing protein n=1 Tax=Actinomyces procaprae TaxID=2560010 RepID=UPI001F007C29|nr:DUF2807 domain-containing protein [Actinomyces procaprae]